MLGNETPLSVTIRGFLARNPGAAMDLFGQSRLPTLVQYDPGSRFFQTHDGTLLFTGDNGIPLVRYHIADEGGIIGHGDMLAFCRRHNFDPLAGLDGARDAPAMPFVYLFGRSLFTVSCHGANIYPENISVGLEQPDVSDWVTENSSWKPSKATTGTASCAPPSRWRTHRGPMRTSSRVRYETSCSASTASSRITCQPSTNCPTCSDVAIVIALFRLGHCKVDCRSCRMNGVASTARRLA